jgi:sugar (pentulose or hexulose) kinase
VAADTVLVIDGGTSAMRVLAVRADGRVTPLAAEPWPMFVPDDATPFGREFDVIALRRVFERLTAAAASHRDALAVVAVTGQREGIAFLDARGEALFASPNIDARASAEGMAIDAKHGPDVYAVTGHLPSLMQAPAKLAWLRTHRPAITARVAHVLPLADWLAALLTGVPLISRSLAAEIGLLDVSRGVAPGDLLARLGFAADLVQPVLHDGSISGEVKEGLLAGLPVVLAGADTQCALVGMGAIEAGSAGLVAGWSAPLQLVTSGPVFDAAHRTWTSVHVVPGRWILESNAGEMGRAFDWICSMMNLDPVQATLLAAEAPAGSGDAMSVLGPRAMRASAMSAGVGGITLPLPLVMSAPERGHILRSVMEATAYAVRANVEQLEQVNGARIDALAIGGGMSRSAAFTQMVADIVDRPVQVAAAPETSAVGAAALAFVSTGLHATLTDVVAAMTAGGSTLSPDARSSAAYDDCYARWCAISEAFERMGGA